MPCAAGPDETIVVPNDTYFIRLKEGSDYLGYLGVKSITTPVVSVVTGSKSDFFRWKVVNSAHNIVTIQLTSNASPALSVPQQADKTKAALGSTFVNWKLTKKDDGLVLVESANTLLALSKASGSSEVDIETEHSSGYDQLWSFEKVPPKGGLDFEDYEDIEETESSHHGGWRIQRETIYLD